MEQRKAYPWGSLALAAVACVLLLTASVPFAYVLAVFVIWAGSLWLASATTPDLPNNSDANRMDKSRFAQLVENAATPMVMVENSRVTHANRAAREVLGNYLVGQDARVAFRQPQAVRLLNRQTNASARIHGLIRPKDEWLLNLQYLETGTAVIELINQTSQADISRAHTDFVANASHELRTPIASIIGYAETLEEDGDDLPLETRERFLQIILTEARRLQVLTEDLMSLSKVEAEKNTPASNSLTLGKLVEIAAKETAGADQADRLEFALDKTGQIAGDRSQIEQLVRNLVDNALKYGNNDTPVKVEVQPFGDNQLGLSVCDKGEGIGAEHIPHLTRRFYRTDPGRSRAKGGTGLGLAIVKHIVERHLAQLEITSKIGKGTCVAIKFNRLDAAELPEQGEVQMGGSKGD